MADEEKPARPPSWWQTTPGILTGVAALITALTGLLIALHQTGLIGARGNADQDAAGQGGAIAVSPASKAAPTVAPKPVAQPGGGTAPRIELPLPHTVTLGTVFVARFTIVSAAVESRNAETRLVTFGVRMRNEASNAVNFWSDAFRLILDDGAVEALGTINEVIGAEADSKVEVVKFVVNKGARPRALRVKHYGESTEIPLGWKP